MENVAKLIHDIFSMSFDVVVPVSGSIIAIIVAFVLFFIRYFTFVHNRKKYEKMQRDENSAEYMENEKIKAGDKPETVEKFIEEALDNKEVSDI